MAGCSTFSCFEESDEYGGDVILKKITCDIPEGVRNVETVHKFTGKQYNIGPLGSYFFAFFVRTGTTFFRLVNPSDIDPGVDAEYRLCVLPGSIRKLSQLSPTGLVQLYLATKYDLQTGRIVPKDNERCNSAKILNRLMFYDLCRLVKHHSSDTSVSVDLFDKRHLHMKLIKQYEKIKIMWKDCWFVSIRKHVLSISKRRLANELKSLVMNNEESMARTTEYDFMVDYLEYVQLKCKNFLLNRYALENVAPSGGVGASVSKWRYVELNWQGVHLVDEKGNVRIISNYQTCKFEDGSRDTSSRNLKFTYTNNENQTELHLRFATPDDKDSFSFELVHYFRVFRNFTGSWLEPRFQFPSQKRQMCNKYFPPLCEETLGENPNFTDEVNQRLSECEEFKMMTSTLAKHPAYNGIACESSDEHNTILVFIANGNNHWKIIRVHCSYTGDFWKHVPNEPNVPKFQNLADLLPPNTNLYFCTDGPLQPFAKSEPQIFESKSYIHGTINCLRRADYQLDKQFTEVIIKRAKSNDKAVVADKKIVHGEINCKNMLIDPKEDPSKIVLCEPSQKNDKPWIPSSYMQMSVELDTFAIGTTKWEILNFGKMPTTNDAEQRVIDDPFLLPYPEGCLVSFYEKHRLDRLSAWNAEFTPLSVQFVGGRMYDSILSCWNYHNPPLLENVLNLMNENFSYLIPGSNTDTQIISFDDKEVILSGRYSSPNCSKLFIRKTEDHFLGRGAFGEVHKWQDINKPSNLFALKQLVATKKFKTTLLTEIQTMANCNHLHVMPYYGHTLDKKDNCIDGILMPYMVNGSLKSYMRMNKGRVPLKQRITFDKQIAEGMDYLNNVKGIIHFDLATRNVLLDENLIVKICDFGLCKLLYTRVDSYPTKSGNPVIETPPWWPCEWINAKNHVNPITGLPDFPMSGDKWCYGITIITMEGLHSDDINVVCDAMHHESYGGVHFQNDGTDAAPVFRPLNSVRQPFLRRLSKKCTKIDPDQRPSWTRIIRDCEAQLRRL